MHKHLTGGSCRHPARAFDTAVQAPAAFISVQ